MFYQKIFGGVMKHFFSCLFIFFLFNKLSLASVNSPITSPTKPEMPRGEKQHFTVKDLDQFNSIKLTLKDDDGNALSFIQVKDTNDTYEVFIPQSDYQKITEIGVQLGNANIHVVNEDEFRELSNRVELTTSGKINMNSYLGGEAGRCVAGTLGGAISGGLAGAAIGGPAGAVAGAIGGVLVGSASTCK
jgi:outer membrane lipoprotein SlyB